MIPRVIPRVIPRGGPLAARNHASTATPPTATATHTATPTPEAAQPVGSMEDFVVDASTTGEDLIDRLSDEETVCIETFGDFIFDIFQGTVLMSGGTDPTAAVPLFNCLTHDNIVLLGAALLDAQAGGRTAESTRSRSISCSGSTGKEIPVIPMRCMHSRSSSMSA